MRKSINYASKFGEYLKNVKCLIGILIVFSIALAGLSLVFPFIWANIIVTLTGSITSASYVTFVKYIVIFVVLEFIEGIINVIKNFVYTLMEERVAGQIKHDMFNKTLSLETKAFDKNRISYFTTKITEEPHRLVAAYFKIISMCITFVKIVCLIALSYKLCFDIGVIFTLASLTIYITILKIKPFLAKESRILNMQVRDYTNLLFENIRNIREVKSLGAKDVVKENFKNSSEEIEKKLSSSKNIDNLMELLMFTIKFSMHSLVLIISTYYFFAELIDFEAIIVLELYAAILFSACRQFSETSSVVMIYKNSLKAIFDILTNKNYMSEKFGNVELSNGDGDLIVKNVSFAFGNRKMVLDDINFEIRRNSKVAIVDKGGNAKQVLLRLLLRQYEPTEGRIMIDDVNIRDFSEKALRRNIMLVSERPLIFNDTLENNIKIVKPSATIEEIVDVCKKTDILKWFDNEILGDIMNVQLGDGGIELSEPQKQLIAIARVLLVNPKIVIIEEAQNDFSSDDTFSIKNALDKITDSTVLIFSDRISSISVCDEIITLSVAKFGAASITKDVIRERNLYGFVSRKKDDDESRSSRGNDRGNRGGKAKAARNNYDEDYDVCYNESNVSNIDKDYADSDIDIDIDTEMNDIKKLNLQKGAKKNDEHRIFSQIW